jgi:thiol-disulfide isomerase/thioredoxin
MALDKEERFEKIRKRITKYENEPALEYKQFLSIILVVGFLTIGGAAGLYFSFKDLMGAPCLGCLGLYPNVEMDFRFETVDNQDHPDFVIDALKKSPVFIEFTQNDENCPPCKRMRPYVKELENEYGDNVQFFIININNNENSIFYKNESIVEPIADSEENSIYRVYDVKDIAGGVVATPTYIIITLDVDIKSDVRPRFAVGYGEFIEESAKKTKDELATTLDFAIEKYDEFDERFKDLF